MNIFKRLFSKAPALENLLNRALYTFTGQQPYLLDANVENYVNDGYKGNIHVYSVVSAILDRCTGIQLTLERNEEPITVSPLLDLLARPNPMQSWEEFIQAYAGWKLLTGNVYVYMIAPDAGLNKGKPIEMWLLPAHVTEIIGGGITEPVTGYRINIGAGAYVKIPAESVIHDRYFNPGYDSSGGQLYGQSPLQAALLTIQASNQGYTALNRAYTHGAPAGILTGSENAEHEYTLEQIQNLDAKWTRKYGGAENYMKILFHRSPLQWIKMGYSVVDMNVIELMKYSLQDVCNIYHAPIHLFSGEAATLDNYKEARKAIYTDCVMPIFDSFVSKMNYALVPLFESGAVMGYDTSVITELNADVQSMTTALASAYWLTGNEKRGMMGLPESDDPLMDAILYPANFIPGVELGNTGNDLSL